MCYCYQKWQTLEISVLSASSRSLFGLPANQRQMNCVKWGDQDEAKMRLRKRPRSCDPSEPISLSSSSPLPEAEMRLRGNDRKAILASSWEEAEMEPKLLSYQYLSASSWPILFLILSLFSASSLVSPQPHLWPAPLPLFLTNLRYLRCSISPWLPWLIVA